MPEYEDISHGICELSSRVRERRPLIHVVTNFVVMNQTANALLALGAAPTMSWAREDAQYMSGISDGLCVNIGTPVKERIEVMQDLMRLAEKTKKPLVLDPVGSGAGPYRTRIASDLLLLAPRKIIRGNASEICSLINRHQATRGIDNTMSMDAAKQILIGHGRTDGKADAFLDAGVGSILPFASAVIVSGQKDMILGQDKVVTLGNGSPVMNLVTGTGCILSAVTAAFYAVSSNGFDAAVAATSVVGIAGECAAQKASGPGTFMAHFLDALYAMDKDTIHTHLKLEVQTPGLGGEF